MFFIGLLASHWLADFVMQSHWMAINKSKRNDALAIHVLIYATWMTVYLCAYFVYHDANLLTLHSAGWFFIATFVTHFATDYITSRINANLWKQEDYHNFFVSVGFDQLVHYTTLYFTLRALGLVQ